MTDIVNNIDIRANNARKIIRALRSSPPITKKDLADSLNLSLPTIMNIVKILSDAQLIREYGSASSSGGRRPTLIGLNSRAKLALGVSVDMHSLRLAVADLNGDIVKDTSGFFPFTGDADYWKRVAATVDEAVAELDIDDARLIGLCVAIPSPLLKASTSREVACTSDMVPEHDIPGFFRYDTVVRDVAEVAGIPLLWYNSVETSRIVLLLNRYIDGTVLSRDPFTGEISTRACEFGHMTVDVGGEPCTCGKNGCLRVYCSAARIIDEINGIDTSGDIYVPAERITVHWSKFFMAIEDGNEAYAALWDKYLYYLAYGVNNLRLLFACDVVLGGDLAAYVERYKESFRARLSALSLSHESADYLHFSTLAEREACIGAALSICDRFMSEL